MRNGLSGTQPRRGFARHGIQEIRVIGTSGLRREPQRQSKLQLVTLLRLLGPALPIGGPAASVPHRLSSELADSENVVVRVCSQTVDLVRRRRGQRRRVVLAGERALSEATPTRLPLKPYRRVQVPDPIPSVITNRVPIQRPLRLQLVVVLRLAGQRRLVKRRRSSGGRRDVLIVGDLA